jgi:hypothetical protein
MLVIFDDQSWIFYFPNSFLGNTGAHADGKSIRLNQVDAVDKFLRAIVEYIYVAPSTVNALRDSWIRSKSQGETS